MERVSAFTLVELLVVIAIIAVLAGMLMPVVGAVRDAARQTVCLSQQRQAMLAITAYAGDNEGLLPPSGGQIAQGSPYTRWYSYLIAGGQVEDGFLAEPLHPWGVRMKYPNPITCPVQRPRSISGQTMQTYLLRWFTSFPGWVSDGLPESLIGQVTLNRIDKAMPYLVEGGDRDPATRTPTKANSYWWNTAANQWVAVLRHHRDRAVVSFPDGRSAARGAAGLDEDRVVNHLAP